MYMYVYGFECTNPVSVNPPEIILAANFSQKSAKSISDHLICFCHFTEALSFLSYQSITDKLLMILKNSIGKRFNEIC